MIQRLINSAVVVAWVAGMYLTMREGIGYGMAYILVSTLFGTLVELWRERRGK